MIHTLDSDEPFLSLGIREPIYPIDTFGYIYSPTEAVKEVRYEGTVKIYGLSFRNKEIKDIMPINILFTLRDIQDNFRGILNTWFEKADKLQPVYDLYFAAIYNPNMYIHHAFLSFIQAVESYHRRDESMIHYAIPQDDFRRMYKKIIEAIKEEPVEYIKILENRFGIINQPFLRKRITEIRDKFSSILGSYIDDESISIIAHTRHSLIHPDEAQKGKVAVGEQLFDITYKLKVMLEVCLLEELSFEHKIIRRVISRQKRI